MDGKKAGGVFGGGKQNEFAKRRPRVTKIKRGLFARRKAGYGRRRERRDNRKTECKGLGGRTDKGRKSRGEGNAENRLTMTNYFGCRKREQ